MKYVCKLLLYPHCRQDFWARVVCKCVFIVSMWMVIWGVNLTAHHVMEQCKIKFLSKDHRRGKEAMSRIKDGIEGEPSRLSGSLTALYGLLLSPF